MVRNPIKYHTCHLSCSQVPTMLKIEIIFSLLKVSSYKKEIICYSNSKWNLLTSSCFLKSINYFDAKFPCEHPKIYHNYRIPIKQQLTRRKLDILVFQTKVSMGYAWRLAREKEEAEHRMLSWLQKFGTSPLFAAFIGGLTKKANLFRNRHGVIS